MSAVSITDIDVVPTIVATGVAVTFGYLFGALVRVRRCARTGIDAVDRRNDRNFPVDVARTPSAGIDPLLGMNQQSGLRSPNGRDGAATTVPATVEHNPGLMVTYKPPAAPNVVRVPNRVRTKFALSLQTNLDAAERIQDPMIRQRALNAMYAAAEHTVDVIEASYSRTPQ